MITASPVPISAPSPTARHPIPAPMRNVPASGIKPAANPDMIGMQAPKLVPPNAKTDVPKTAVRLRLFAIAKNVQANIAKLAANPAISGMLQRRAAPKNVKTAVRVAIPKRKCLVNTEQKPSLPNFVAKPVTNVKPRLVQTDCFTILRGMIVFVLAEDHHLTAVHVCSDRLMQQTIAAQILTESFAFGVRNHFTMYIRIIATAHGN